MPRRGHDAPVGRIRTCACGLTRSHFDAFVELHLDLAQTAGLLVTMGCGESCPFIPGLARLDWPIADPKGQPTERVREIRNEIPRTRSAPRRLAQLIATVRIKAQTEGASLTKL